VHHYKVYKEDDGVSAQTGIVKLNKEQRVEEIAQMLDGKNFSTSAQEHAKQLLLS
jgi:DNA repair protein RecN (Recombination protein N)